MFLVLLLLFSLFWGNLVTPSSSELFVDFTELFVLFELISFPSSASAFLRVQISSLEFYGFNSVQTSSHEFPWILWVQMSSDKIPWVLWVQMSSDKFFRVFLSSPESPWVALSPFEFPWVLWHSEITFQSNLFLFMYIILYSGKENYQVNQFWNLVKSVSSYERFHPQLVWGFL